MRGEMDRAWKNFFDRDVPRKPRLVGGELHKNPDKKEEDLWRRIEGNYFPFLRK
jgi:hypothetical protein